MDELEHESTSGSLVNLKTKPPTKGRKKKSAAAKLVERKRRDSECGSEFGSSASLRIADFSGSRENVNETPKAQLGSNSKLNGNSEANDLGETVRDKNKENTRKNGETEEIAGVKNEKKINNNDTGINHSESDDKKLVTDKAPRPVPRKLGRQRSLRSNHALDDVVSGTVVSIYDKIERAPSNRKKRDPSPNAKPDIKRELFGGSPSDAASTGLGTGQGISGLSSLGDLPSLDGGHSLKNDYNLEHTEQDKSEQALSKTAPSDSGVHRFRSMRMGPDRSKSEESLKKAQFFPKPPPTPRSSRSNSGKGEKLTPEANSSTEDADLGTKDSKSEVENHNIVNTSLSNLQAVEAKPMETESAKPSLRRGLVIHPHLKEVPDYPHLNRNQNMNTDKESEVLATTDQTSPKLVESASSEVSPDKQGSTGDNSPKDNGVAELSKKSTGDKKKRKNRVKAVKPTVRKLAALDGADVDSTTHIDKPVNSADSTIFSLGSASDLQAVNEQYKQVLEDTKNNTIDSSVNRNMEDVLPEPKGTGKLSPILQPKNLPPLGHNITSTSLRTSHKADPPPTMNKYFGRSLSGSTERDRTRFEAMSQRSFSQTIHTLSTKEARDRMKNDMGSSLLSSPELDRYLTDRKVGVWVGSWNMAEIKDCKEPLDDFLLPEISEYVQDIYAIGTQENAMNKKEWEILLQETIGPSHVLFHSASHGALHLAVFVKRDLIWFFTVPEDDLVQTRAVTMVKTKGAIGISFNFFGTSFLFMNCHFAAGDDKKKERNDDYMRIIRQMNLPKQGNTASPNSSSQDVTQRFDSVFWMGDLNFRIEVYKGKEAVEDLVRVIQEKEHPNFEDLLSGDQLSKLIVEGSIFQGFQEGRINFRPTYKYDIGKTTYDTSTKNRIPSYTDRVLFRAKKKNSITCTHYDSPINVTLSDHRPVFAIFEVAVRPSRDGQQSLAAGSFDRGVYLEANRRRTMKVEVIKTFQKEKSSKVCSIQ